MQTSPFSPAQLAGFHDTYQRDGVVKVPGLLSAAWVARLGAALQRARQVLTARAAPTANPRLGRTDGANALASETATRADDGYSTAQYSEARGRLTIRWLWRDDPEVRAFFTHAGVAPVVAAVIGARRLQYWYDLTFFQDPDADGAGSPWHHDIAAFPCKGEQIPSLWIAMTDIDRRMSPLQCIRGSHRGLTQYRPPVYVDPGLPLPDGYADMPDVESRIASGEFERISWDFRAGDALLIHPYTLHGAPPNESDQGRIAFTTRWAGDDVVWKPDAFSMAVPGVDLARVPVGERPSGPLFPYA
ncbi:MAG: phytanoyl-CoA dioxygenase family protein [Steroidobacteraceae bacterium]|jgi:ectoine hydroxylase-related dioxygenase (phytanoyl-CoA dioxygenase family)|nr:phytanoyl-CoA dioxygenase family protein [Steroidobacteraceae bacterium]